MKYQLTKYALLRIEQLKAQNKPPIALKGLKKYNLENLTEAQAEELYANGKSALIEPAPKKKSKKQEEDVIPTDE